MTYIYITAWLAGWVFTLYLFNKSSRETNPLYAMAWYAGPIMLPIWPIVMLGYIFSI